MSASCDSDRVTRQVIKNVLAKLQKEGEGALVRNGITEIEPKNLELSSLEIPRAEKDGVEVKVIAGDSLGIKSPYYTTTPIMFLDFTLKPGSQTHQTVPESWTAFAYILEGDEGVFGSLKSLAIQAHHVVVFGPGDLVSVWNKSTSRALRFLLIAGEPIGEPLVQCGPFVMSSQDEIDMAFEDYRNAKNGFELAKSS
uniref:Pirin C-terminal domain-containing protein n=1 Tax=Brassica campestris TaxID=3711 RepID=M4CT94_BRACM